ncbi:MAG: aminoacyl-histidine dipeptidase [Defluviitaleaceae bacterium]|nr:aminoacyl-histidine dipeptidase [Defluviitaleaceae bacterium]
MNILKSLEPQSVFYIFEQISSIPRGSLEEKQVSDWLVKWAKERNLTVVQDTENNVIITKAASPGYENAPAVILQTHMDMVCEKNAGVTHDFSKDPLQLYIDGDLIKATDTTLGADNGIGVAMSLAILDGSYSHPKLAALITTNEESGMSGARAVDPSLFTDYKYMINLDTAEEGEFTTSCSGGIRHTIEISTGNIPIPADYITCEVHVKGLAGGHSGGDIHKGLANSNRVLARVLHKIFENDNILLSHIEGGAKDNAIPREAYALVSFPADKKSIVSVIIEKMQEDLKKEYWEWEPELKVYAQEVETLKQAFSPASTKNIIKALMIAPLGLVSATKAGNTMASSNIGVVFTKDNTVTISCLTRSNILSIRDYMQAQMQYVAEVCNGEYITLSSYDGWEYREDSPLRDICVAVYKQIYGKDPLVTSTHGGLECGILSTKMPHLDIISFGPNNYNLHTPQEQLSISSSKRVYEFLLKVLEAIN